MTNWATKWMHDDEKKGFVSIKFLKNTSFHTYNYPFGIGSYLGNDTFGFLSVWEIIIWGKNHLGKYPTAISNAFVLYI